MRLLGWDQIHSKEKIGAILFRTPVRVSSIRIFPTGAQPFSESPDLVAYESSAISVQAV